MNPTPGSWHSRILTAHAEALKVNNGTPVNYLEIGVFLAETFNAVLPHTGVAVGVDPDSNCAAYMQGGEFVWKKSDEYFAGDIAERFDIVFIDGLHTEEQVERDFHNSIRVLKPHGFIYLHDTWPIEESHTVPSCCGDVWRFAKYLEQTYSRCMTYQAFPGLTVVQPNPQKRIFEI